MPATTKIKLKRTTLDTSATEVSQEVLNFGEPIVVEKTTGTNTDTYMYIGVSSEDKSANQLKAFKALPRAQVDKQLFYEPTGHSQETGNGVNAYLYNEAHEWLIPEVTADQVYWDDAETSTDTVKDKIDILNTKTAHIDGSHYYAASSSENGPASSASKLSNTAAIGSNTLPVYFTENGIPAAVASTGSGTAVQIDISGSANLATNATNVTVAQQNDTILYLTGVTNSSTTAANYGLKTNSNVRVNAANVIMGAAWNDFAEFRQCNEDAGTVVVEVGDGSLERSYDRLQKGAAIISDTYGMVIGPEKEGYKPVAVAGRVLAKTFERNFLKPGDAVCTDKYGAVSKMKWWEVILHPDCIVGYVSEIPTYAVWNGVLVENRIWIKVK